MKLFRYKESESTRPGIIIDKKMYDVSAVVKDYNEEFFSADGINRLETLTAENKSQFKLLADDIILDSCVARPSKIICIGLNYHDHAKEINAASPTEPVVFLKATTALSAPNADIIIPQNSKKTDWEVELAIIIGKKASYVSEDEAMNYVAGYCLHNDVSEREFQMERGGTWDKGKGCDTFAPMGPWLVTKDEIKDVNALKLSLNVNDETMQDGTTAELIFKVPFIISYVSRFMTLLPGDIISTGTPAGVGLGKSPQVFLKAGDIIESAIDGLGSATQHVKAYAGN